MATGKFFVALDIDDAEDLRDAMLERHHAEPWSNRVLQALEEAGVGSPFDQERHEWSVKA